MSSIADSMGWSEEYASQIVQESTKITYDTIKSKNTSWRRIVEDIDALDHPVQDKIMMGISIGMFIGKVIANKGID